MRIGLNLLHTQPEIGGGWVYIANLIAGLAEYPGEHHFVAFVNPLSARIVPAHPRFSAVRLPVRPASRVQRVLYENTRLPGLVREMKLDLVHWFSNTHTPFSRTPSAVTVYDLLAFTPSAPWGVIKLAYLRLMIRHAIRTANVLLPISQATAADIQERFSVNADRMRVVSSVLPSKFKPADAAHVADFKRTHGLPSNYWLYVAHFYAHKNHATLVDAYRRLVEQGRDHGWPLVLRGEGDEAIAALRRRVAEGGLDGRVILLPRLSDSDMAALYTGAGALVFPSRFEGLGIPVLEAMACGCPVLAAPLPAVIESGGDALLTFDPESTEALTEAMAGLAADPDTRSLLRAKGLARAVRFRAAVVVPDLINAYEHAVAGTRGSRERRMGISRT